jgi:hypothetical protein
MVGKLLLLSLTFGLVAGCRIHPQGKQRMNLQDMLATVHNDRIEFVTARPPGSEFTTLERRVIVTGPPGLVELSTSDDPQALNHLVELLRDRDRAWAAEVLLAAITDHESKIVDAFAATPDQWWDAVGKTAHERWVTWLSQSK